MSGAEANDMEQPITGFHLDEENDWVAELACGHFQHVRHKPPWLSGRGSSLLGQRLNCRKCESGAPLDRN